LVSINGINHFADGYKWAHNGPYCITRTFKEKCSKKITRKGGYTQPLNKFCENIDYLSQTRFYPIHYRKTWIMKATYSDHCDLLSDIASNGLGVHWWHKFLENDEKKEVKTKKDSVFGKLFQVECPKVIAAHGWEGLGFDSKDLD
jgi:hypothetical protein